MEGNGKKTKQNRLERRTWKGNEKELERKPGAMHVFKQEIAKQALFRLGLALGTSSLEWKVVKSN